MAKSMQIAVGVLCWHYAIIGRQVIVFLLRSLCPCQVSWITTDFTVGVADSDKR